jgi:hypothetical protein
LHAQLRGNQVLGVCRILPRLGTATQASIARGGKKGERQSGKKPKDWDTQVKLKRCPLRSDLNAPAQTLNHAEIRKHGLTDRKPVEDRLERTWGPALDRREIFVKGRLRETVQATEDEDFTA